MAGRWEANEPGRVGMVGGGTGRGGRSVGKVKREKVGGERSVGARSESEVWVEGGRWEVNVEGGGLKVEGLGESSVGKGGGQGQ